jgi:predicted  nucleic acid-binding Zn-ribbon protein
MQSGGEERLQRAEVKWDRADARLSKVHEALERLEKRRAQLQKEMDAESPQRQFDEIAIDLAIVEAAIATLQTHFEASFNEARLRHDEFAELRDI